ncbi:MAG: tyrosine--tRNA ligase [Candidatus Margulisbacteria bacterium]|nr:tyrosine--tRNA ligase [Candidatus Margulisiibacteriota bacterium]
MDAIIKGFVDVINFDDLKDLLNSKKRLKVKWGADPSAPDLHLGHTVVLRKLKILQDLGHEIIFLIGDFTAMIGDPTGKSKTRKELSEEQVIENAETYQSQVFKILDKDKTTVVYNSTWLSKLTAKDMVKLTAKYNVARMLERDDFNKRFSNNISISIHEFLYPLLQGYDSVELEADIEMGGTDQKFNLLVGRHLQKEYGQKPQVILTMPILEGLDGVQKMSKSLGNHVGLTDTPNEMFGKLMSIPDELIVRYFELLTDVCSTKIDEMKKQMKDGSVNPRDLKVNLGKTIVGMYHSKEEADKAEEYFITAFRQKDIPEDIPELCVSKIKGDLTLINILKFAEMASSNKEIKRLFEQGAVSLDGEKITDPFFELEKDKEVVIKSGKRNFLKILW